MVGMFALLAAGVSGCKPKVHPADAAKGYDVFWRCRKDGATTNWSALEVRQMMGEGKYRQEETPLPIFLLPCPKCGKMEMEQVFTSPPAEKPK